MPRRRSRARGALDLPSDSDLHTHTSIYGYSPPRVNVVSRSTAPSHASADHCGLPPTVRDRPTLARCRRNGRRRNQSRIAGSCPDDICKPLPTLDIARLDCLDVNGNAVGCFSRARFQACVDRRSYPQNKRTGHADAVFVLFFVAPSYCQSAPTNSPRGTRNTAIRMRRASRYVEMISVARYGFLAPGALDPLVVSVWRDA